jgi:hypothetical protein
VSSAWAKVTSHTDGHFITTEDTGDPGDGTANGAYIAGLLVEPGAGTAGADRLHVTYLFRTGDFTTQGNIGYLRSNNAGVTWQTIDGTPVTIPMTWAQRATPLIDTAPTNVPAYQQGITVDGDGNPHISFDTNELALGVSIFDRTWWDGDEWQTEGSGTFDVINSWLYFDGSLWRREVTETGKHALLLTNLDTDAEVYMSHQVDTDCTPTPDPIRLRDGVYSTLVPNGSTPRFYEYAGRQQYRAIPEP